jgi:hypothetical protein
MSASPSPSRHRRRQGRDRRPDQGRHRRARLARRQIQPVTPDIADSLGLAEPRAPRRPSRRRLARRQGRHQVGRRDHRVDGEDRSRSARPRPHRVGSIRPARPSTSRSGATASRDRLGRARRTAGEQKQAGPTSTDPSAPAKPRPGACRSRPDSSRRPKTARAVVTTSIRTRDAADKGIQAGDVITSSTIQRCGQCRRCD